LRRGRRAVWLYESHCEKQRLVFVLFEKMNRACGRLVIAVLLPVSFKHDDAIGLRRLPPGAGGQSARSRLRGGVRLATLGYRGISRLAAFCPGLHVVDPAVENLPAAKRRITVRLEMLRQRNIVRMFLAKIEVVVHHSCLRWVLPRQERRARRIAKRVLAIGAIKPRGSRGELIDVRSFDDLIAVATKFGA